MVVIPGLPWGDYLMLWCDRSFFPVMRRCGKHAQQGKFVLGICNGFQVLTEQTITWRNWYGIGFAFLFAIASLK